MHYELKKEHLGLSVDWQGNNIAICCPSCSKVFIVSGMMHRDGRKCPNPNCGELKAFVSQDGKTAFVECDEKIMTMWKSF